MTKQDDWSVIPTEDYRHLIEINKWARRYVLADAATEADAYLELLIDALDAFADIEVG